MRLRLKFKCAEETRPRGRTARLLRLGAGCAAGLAAAAVLSAQGESSVVELDPFTVFGGPEGVVFTPGAGYLIGERELEIHRHDNIDQAIRRVPGAYFRTEDGYGLFPNISFRGVGSMRTSKLTVMEDGILSAPAPYANPSAYYTPTTGRMRGLEILKGSSQVKYGPRTTGGVLNYLSTAIPAEGAGRIALTIGENQELRFHGWYGDVFATEAGDVGMLIEHYFRRTDGFKSIDTNATFAGGSTGFVKNEPMLKLSFTPANGPAQRFELKVGHTDLVADETYLGLTTEDFRANPHRRYISTQFDRIPTEQWRTHLRHVIDIGPDTSLLSTIYYNQFSRSWYKLHDVRRIGGGAVSLAGALAGSPFYDGAGAIAGTEGEPLAVLRGEAAGIWRVRDNNRAYKSHGVESIFRHSVDAGAVTHALEFGARLHEDYEDRFQKQDDYTVDAAGNVTGVVRRRLGTQDNRRGTARALALYAKDSISWDGLTVVPGIRYERIRYTDERRGTDPDSPDFNQVTSVRRGTLDVAAPGVGATYAMGHGWMAFGGVHRGFSLPSPGAAVHPANPVGEETSLGYELGARYDRNGAVRAEAVLFWTDFSNLIVPDNIGGAGTGVTENAGDVRTRGLELAGTFDPGLLHGWSFRNPYSLAYTYTDATIRSDVSASGTSGGAVESIFAGGARGNRLPYVPRHQISLGAGLEFERFGVHLDAFYVASTYASANNSAEEVNPFGGPDLGPVPDARFGKSDAYFLLDAAVHYEVLPGVRLNAGVQNLLDREYMASRIPHGPRPGHPRFFHAGMTWDF